MLTRPGFAFVPHGSCLLGFGFDAPSNDYKVVRIVYQPENYNYKVPPSVEIYSLNTGTWRSICAAAPRYVVYNFFSLPAFVNGAVHWVASSSGRSLIVAFDMGAEVFREMMIPDSVAHTDVLKLCSTEYGVVESWTKLLTIDMRDGIRQVVGFRKNSEVLLSARVKGLVSYDPKIQQIKYLGIHGSNRSFYADAYVESLVLLERESAVLRQETSCDAVSSKLASVSLREEDGAEEEQKG
ncbi:hypothetical protein F0562_008189 [Nyssa sinensis]|uniref:F-box associated beta-propeller type 1 domain-containing protein n=1 Tax=Nyssa sinensis TaxID=561372 RepID=A0A5J5A9A4_9ASTE|nr:hypothetical protein F0562_008189 [Nyssa sinensis]